jgi:hypothetical protein
MAGRGEIENGKAAVSKTDGPFNEISFIIRSAMGHYVGHIPDNGLFCGALSVFPDNTGNTAQILHTFLSMFTR